MLAEDRAAAFKAIKEKIEEALFKKHATPSSTQANVPSTAANLGKLLDLLPLQDTESATVGLIEDIKTKDDAGSTKKDFHDNENATSAESKQTKDETTGKTEKDRDVVDVPAEKGSKGDIWKDDCITIQSHTCSGAQSTNNIEVFGTECSSTHVMNAGSSRGCDEPHSEGSDVNGAMPLDAVLQDSHLSLTSHSKQLDDGRGEINTSLQASLDDGAADGGFQSKKIDAHVVQGKLKIN